VSVLAVLAAACSSGSPATSGSSGSTSDVPSGAPASSGSVKVEKGLQYADPGGTPLTLNAFLPPGQGPHPGVVLIHGGGWHAGSSRITDPVGMALARRGFAAFSINYRLAPKFPWPAAFDDAQSAVRWVRANASKYDVNPDELAAMGGSAGGNLALLLATSGEGTLDSGARVRVAVSWSGATNLTTLLAANIPKATANINDFVQCPGPSCQANLAAASPVTHVDSTDSTMLIVNSSNEIIPFQQAQEMADADKRAGVPYELVQVPGDKHAQAYLTSTVPTMSNETVAEISMSFLQKWIGNTRT
jgi:acetyl esterase/lipase